MPTVPFYGRKVKPERIAHDLRHTLLPNEHILAAAVSIAFRPMTDIVAITNLRVVSYLRADLPNLAVDVDLQGIRGHTLRKRRLLDGLIIELELDEQTTVTLGVLRYDSDREALSRALTAAVTGLERQARGQARPPTIIGKSVLSATKLLDELAQILPKHEKVRGIWLTRQVDPRIDLIVLTDLRLLGLCRANLRGPHLQLRAAQIDHAVIGDDGQTDTVLVTTTDARFLSLGQLYAKSDHQTVLDQINALPRTNDQDQEAADEAEPFSAENVTDRWLRSPAHHQAIQDGLPISASDYFEDLRKGIARTTGYAARGNVVEEELARLRIFDYTQRLPRGSRRAAQRWLAQEIDRLERAGELRIGSNFVGTVEPRGITLAGVPIPGLKAGDLLIVRSDRIHVGTDIHPVDDQLEAAVYLDGQVFESHRPSLITMALGSFLPGTALIPGLAMPVRERNDELVASFVVTHPDWQAVIPIDPAAAHTARPLAARINALARSAGEPHHQTVEPPLDVLTAGRYQDQLDHLERLGALIEKGLLTTTEFEHLKRQIVNE